MIDEKQPTHNTLLDTFLEGGLEKDAITTIYGPAGSGKTNMAMITAMNIARTGKKVIYIDTEGGFSISRLKQIYPDYEDYIERIIFIKPTTFDEQRKAIEQLIHLNPDHAGVIILDTIGMLYRLERKGNDDATDFNKELGTQIRTLTEIARKKQIPILITNQVYTNFNDNKIHMIGGDPLIYASKCLIELEALKNQYRRALLQKHRSIKEGKTLTYAIINEGIQEVEEKKSFKIF